MMSQRVWEDYHIEDAVRRLSDSEDGRLAFYHTHQQPDGSMFCRCKGFAYHQRCHHIWYFMFRQVVVASAELRGVANGGVEAMLDGVRRTLAGNPGASKNLKLAIMLVAASQGTVSAASLRSIMPLESLLPPEASRNTIGATFLALYSEGLLIAVGREPNNHGSAHARRVTKWALTPKGRNALALSSPRIGEDGEPIEVIEKTPPRPGGRGEVQKAPPEGLGTTGAEVIYQGGDSNG